MGDAGEGAVGWNPVVVRSAGKYYAITSAEPAAVLVFAENGAFERILGTRGEGPSEFKAINNIAVGPDGRLWLLDQGNLAVKVMADDGQVIESYPARFSTSRWGMVLLPDSSLVLNSLIPVAHLVGLWSHRWHPTRGHVWSAEDSDVLTRGAIKQRVFAVDGEDLWVAQRWDRYRLELRSLESGALRRSVEPRRSWFEDFAQQPTQDPDPDVVGLVRPKATIAALRVVDGQLWVLGYTGAEGWEEAAGDGFTNLGVLLDNVVEVFDVDTGRLLVSTRLDLPNAVGLAFLDDRSIVAHETNPVVDRIVIYRLNLTGPVPR